MRREQNLKRLLLTILSVILTVVASAGADQGGAAQQITKPGMTVVESAPVKLSKPLRSLVPASIDPAAPSAARTFQDIRLINPKTLQGSATKGMDSSIVQDRPIGASMPTATANFEGVNNVSGVLPPDTQGDIGYDPATGKKYYVQWVNLAYQMWDVSNPAAPLKLLASPAAGNALWAGTGGICDTNNDGDPLTRFDHLSNRWVMSQFALGFPNNFHQCIAVSQTADPSGAWYLYDFKTSTTVMNDYGKLGVWPDGYYMSFNQFDGTNSAWAGAAVAVFERDKMLLGQAARMIYINIGAGNLNYGGMLPSDLDGVAPSAGTPNYFMEWDDTAYMGDAADTLRVWEFKTDWSNPANTTFGLNTAFDPNLKIVTANVDPNMCGGSSNCIVQPGTAQKLDAIADRLMYRLQYRNFGTYQTIVGNHTVDAASTDKAGIHWFELRNTGSGFAMYQEGVYAPDADNRWMASAAMDISGNIALGYSVSGSTTYPSIRYTGRLASDPPNTLPQGEATLMVGSGSQTHTAARWGDYSMMAVDPSDGCTFWYTQEYMQTTSSAGWQTRIGSFKFPSCTSQTTGTLSGTVTNSASVPIAGVVIEITGGYTTVTDAVGHYSISLVSGTYNVTASKYGFLPDTANGVIITPPDTTARNFTLAISQTYTISGVVKDGTTSWPLYARIDIAGYPGGSIFTDPLTGAYSVGLAYGSYTFTVTAMSGGYNSLSQPVAVTASATSNISLSPDVAACNAPGYFKAPITTDGFDTSTAPAFSSGWGVVDVTGTLGNWVTSITSTYPAGIVPHSAPNMAIFNSYDTSGGEQTRLYQKSGTNLSSITGAEVSLWMYHETQYSEADSLQVQVSTDAGATWNNAGTPITRYNRTTGWGKHTVDISAYTGAGKTDVRIGLLGTSLYGNNIHIDNFAVSKTCTPMASAGLVTGTVYDANNGLPISNPTVKDAALNSAVIIDASSDPSTPVKMYVIAQPAGVSQLTASAPFYDSRQLSPTVVAGITVRQDFQLLAGKLSVTPTSLVFTVTKDTPAASQPLSLANAGGVFANYQIFSLAGTFTPPVPTGPFAENTRHIGPKNLNDRDARNIRVDLTPTGVTPLIAGDVSASWPTGLTASWGIGFNTDASDLWIGSNLFFGGSNLDYRFTTAGVKSGDTIDITPWAIASTWGADMAYNPFTKSIWQIHVGGDNCIYELNPATKLSTGNKICPAFGTSERGLAYDPVSNTYYSGSWTDGIINHFSPDGTILDSKAVGLNISGLAYNPGTGHLFAMTNTNNSSDPQKFDVYVLDAKASYSISGGFNLRSGVVKSFTDNAQAGLELDCSGNLWAVDQKANKVYVVSSGETGVCDWQPGWLTVTPLSGSVAAAGTAPLSAAVNASSIPEGIHTGYLKVANSTPYGSLVVPITLTVNSKLAVSKSGAGSGTVTSLPGGINCGVDCTEQYAPNSVVSLSAVPATYSTFTGWGGDADCADGVVTLNTSKSCIATFSITPIRVPDQYATIQAAYDALPANGSIQSLVHTYTENVRFNRPITALLFGGYIPDWTAASGMTTIQGSLTISQGKAIVSNLIIR